MSVKAPPGNNAAAVWEWPLTILENRGPIQLYHSLVGILILFHVTHDSEPLNVQQREASLACSSSGIRVLAGRGQGHGEGPR
jgi:hypothetical protein